MLSRAHRMSRSQDFHEAVRTGSRAGCDTLVVHARLQDATAEATDDRARIGFIVSKTVGTAVVRNRVRRRLRHLARTWADELTPGSRVVVRALPPSASASAAQLDSDLESCRRRAVRKAERAVST